jgi:hypothetical protein
MVGDGIVLLFKVDSGLEEFWTTDALSQKTLVAPLIAAPIILS